MRKLFTILAIAILPTISNAQTNQLFNYIPENAEGVVHLDLFRLGVKLPLSTLKSSYIFKSLDRSGKSSFFTLLTDPNSSGIDLASGLMIVVESGSGGRMQYDVPAVSIFAKLNNAVTFTNRMNELHVENGIRIYGTDRIIVSESPMSMAWNNDVVVLTSRYDRSIMNDFWMSTASDTTIVLADTTSIVVPDTIVPVSRSYDYRILEEKIRRSKRDACFDLLTRKNDNTISEDPVFLELMEVKADGKIFSKGQKSNLPAQFFGLGEFFTRLQSISGEKAVATINFEKGRIVTKGYNYPGQTIDAIYQKHNTTVHNTELIKRLPNDARFGLLSVSMNDEIAKEFKKALGLDELLKKQHEEGNDYSESRFPFNPELLNGALKSQLLIAILRGIDPGHKHDEECEEEDNSHKGFGPLPFFAFEIADKQKFEDLKKAILESISKAKEEGNDKMDFADFVIKNNDKYAVFTLNESWADRFLTSSQDEIPTWIREYSTYPILANIDFNLIVNPRPGEMGQGNRHPMEAMLQNTFDQLVFYGGKYENGKVLNNMEFRFANKEENAFKQLFDVINKFAERNLSEQEEIMNQYKNNNIKIQEVTITDVKQESKKIVPPPPPPKQNPPKVIVKPVQKN